MTDRAALAALAARDAVRALIVLDRLRAGPATNADLRHAAGYPGDSFRSLLRRMQRDGLIERATPNGRGRGRWALAQYATMNGPPVDRLAA